MTKSNTTITTLPASSKQVSFESLSIGQCFEAPSNDGILNRGIKTSCSNYYNFTYGVNVDVTIPFNVELIDMVSIVFQKV